MTGLSRYREALALCEAELKHSSKSPELLCSRGIAWMELGEVEKAGRDYEAALKLSHGNQTVFYNLACLSMKQKSPQKALAFLAKATRGNARLANQALMDKEFDPLGDNLRFWKIIAKAVHLDDAMLWRLCKKFKVKSI
jgi:Flp pilus assembly protein TadD